MDSITTTRTVISVIRDENISLLAASIAYYAFTSIMPLLLLALSIGSRLGGQAFAQRIVSAVQEQLSTHGAIVVERALTDPTGRAGASILGIVVLIWSGIRVFRGLDLAFNEIYGTESQTGVLEQIKDGFTVLIAISLGVVLLIGLGILLDWAPTITLPYINLLGYIAVIGGLVVVFLPLYYVLPPVTVSVREVVPGTVLLAIGWLILRTVFQVYVANAGAYQAYGLLGAVLLFLIWLYLASMLLLVGAAVNAVLGGRNQSS